MDKYTELKKVLEGRASFLLIAHEDPDGDCLGAMLSLGVILEKMEKRVAMVTKNEIPGLLDFLIGSANITHDFLLGDWQTIILIDNGDLKRTGFAARILKAKNAGKIIINIDHHPQNDIWKIADLNLAKTSASSTCEIVFDIFKQLEIQITPDIATNLLAGIYYDTGGFVHSNTSDKVLNITSELLLSGANLRKVSRSVNQSRSVAMLKLWGIALDRIKIIKNKNLAYTVISQSDIKKTGAGEEDVSGLVNLVNTASEAAATLLIYETNDGKIKGSLRTENDKVDVSKFAQMLGGGGHKKAAGFSIAGKLSKKSGIWQIT